MDFNAILKNSLAVLNDGYAEAHDDLVNTVDQVRAALDNHLGGEAALELRKTSGDINASVFRLYLDPNPENSDVPVVTIVHFRLPPAGYPISHGTHRKASNSFDAVGEISNKEELLQLFADWLTSPESALMQAIGFALRERHK